MFRFNHPKEAAKLREKRKVSSLESPGSSSDLGGDWGGGGGAGHRVWVGRGAVSTLVPAA